MIDKELGALRPGEKRDISISHPDFGDVKIERQKNPRSPNKFMKKHFPAFVGIFFVLIAIILAFSFPEPTPLQIRVILAVLSLGGGAFGTEISGMIKVNLSLGEKFVIGATGAAAIFVILYFAVPAS